MRYYYFNQDNLEGKFLPHPIFKVAYKVTYLHSEIVYNTNTKNLLEMLKDFEKIRVEIEREFNKRPDFFQEYKLLAHIIWRTYHQKEAKTLLEGIINYDPKQTETHFYLGQIYQDELKNIPQAITHYEQFIELEPNLIPENNFFIDGWFITEHAYKPSTIEAFINLGDIFLSYYQEHKQAKEYYLKAINLNPNHHLAPFTRLAEILIKEQSFSSAFKAYKKAFKNYVETDWKNYPYDYPCKYYPKLEAWAKQKYPFTYRHHRAGIELFAKKMEELAEISYEKTKNAKFALTCLGVVNGMAQEYSLRRDANSYLKQIELVLEHYHDYWQAESLCLKVLGLDNSNKKAQEYLQIIKEKIR